jgi:hypothetical protein
MSAQLVKIIDEGSDKATLLELIDEMRADVEAGKIVAVAAVGITKIDNLEYYLGFVRSGSGVSKNDLQITGAIQHLLNSFLKGDLD